MNKLLINFIVNESEDLIYDMFKKFCKQTWSFSINASLTITEDTEREK